MHRQQARQSCPCWPRAASALLMPLVQKLRTTISFVKSIDHIEGIHMVDINRFDLNLLRVLDAMLSESQVSAAARRLNRSQPAMSAALTRLREALQDPILVRDGQRMRLT